MHVDVIIVGQGIAGTVLADQLLSLGYRVALIDRGINRGATAIAAGLMEPLSGRKLAKAWEAETVFPEAVAYYEALSQRVGCSLIQTYPVQRAFSAEQAALWPSKQRLFSRFSWHPIPVSDAFPHGGVSMSGAVVNTSRLLVAMRARFRRLGILRTGEVRDPSVLFSADNIYGLSGTYVVCATGTGIDALACWSQLPLQYSSGEVMCVRWHGPVPLSQVAGEWVVRHDRTYWVVPYSRGQLRIGATYRPYASQLYVDLSGAAALRAYAQEVLGQSLVSVPYGIYSGGRCLGIHGRFIVDEHPTIPRLWTITGLGSKGVMLAPRLARDWIRKMADNAKT